MTACFWPDTMAEGAGEVSMENKSAEQALEQAEVEVRTPTRRHRPPNDREQKILEYLRFHPQATYVALQVATGLKTHEVEWALKEMRKKGWVDSGYRVSPTALGFPERYRVDIWVLPTVLRAGLGGRLQDTDQARKRLVVDSQERLGRYIMETLAYDPAFKDRILIEDVHILLGGPADMSATVRARDNKSMLDFVVNGLRICEGVQQTTTYLLSWSFPDLKL